MPRSSEAPAPPRESNAEASAVRNWPTERDPLLLEEQALAGKDATYSTALLCALLFFTFAMQNLMAPNLTAIALDFGFSEEERDRKLGGEVALGFFIVGAPVAVFAGYLADLSVRKLLLVSVVFFGEIPTVLTLFVSEFWQLWALRVCVGISIGGAPPLLLSMVGDMYPSSTRMAMTSYMMLFGALGVAAGQLVSGLFGPAYGWRLPFALIGVPACLVNLLVLFTVAEPKRGYADLSHHERFTRRPGDTDVPDAKEERGEPEYAYESRITPGKLLGLFTQKSNLILFVQGIPGCLPWAVAITFMNDYLAQEKDLSVVAATVVMTAWNLGICAGILIGGHLGQLLYNLKPRFVPLLMGITTFMGIFPLMFLVWLPTPAPFIVSVVTVAAIGGVLTGITSPCLRALLLSVNAPETRGSAQAMLVLTDDLGKGLGPFAMAMLIVIFGSRTHALALAVCVGWTLAGVMLCCPYFTIEADEEETKRRVLAGEGPPTCCLE